MRDPLFWFFLTVLFWLVAWAGCNAIPRLPDNPPFTAVWNKVCAICCLIAGIIAIVLLIIRAL